MTTTIDNKVNPKVLAMLTKYGRNLVLRTYPSRTVNKVTSVVTDGSPTDVTVKGFGPLDYDARYVDGDTIKVGDSYFLMAPKNASGSAVLPAVGDVLPIGSKVWRVVSVKPYSGGEDVALYELQVRS